MRRLQCHTLPDFPGHWYYTGVDPWLGGDIWLNTSSQTGGRAEHRQTDGPTTGKDAHVCYKITEYRLLLLI